MEVYMKIATLLKTGLISTLAFAAASQAAPGTRSANSLPAPPAASANASDKSQGLPNANGEKPGRGDGQGHIDERGRGHEMGRGHGHDSDPDSPG
jgi:hypothetical protein